MKLKEWLKTIILPLVEKPEDADLFLAASDLKEVEVTDDLAKAFTTKYLTRERALTDEDILKKVQIGARGMVFDSVDLKLKHLINKLTPDDQAIINSEPNTLLKLEKLSTALDNLAKNEDVKKASEAFRKKEEEFHKKISDLEGTIKEKDSNFAKQLSGHKVDYFLRNKVAGLKLAPEFASDKHKEFLAASTIDLLKKSYHLEYDEASQSVPLRKSVEGALVDVYEGNTKLTLDDVLKKEYEPYIEKNNSGGKPDTTHKPQQPVVRAPLSDQPTLHDLRWANAENQ